MHKSLLAMKLQRQDFGRAEFRIGLHEQRTPICLPLGGLAFAQGENGSFEHTSDVQCFLAILVEWIRVHW